jgi:hypothetical protein
MNVKLVGALITIGLFAVGGGYMYLSQTAPHLVPGFGARTGKCMTNDAIPPGTRAEITAAATTFVQTLASDTPDDVLKLMSRRGRSEVRQQGSLDNVVQQYNSMPAAELPVVPAVFFLQGPGGNALGVNVPCRAPDGVGTALVPRGSTPLSAVALVHEAVGGDSRKTSQVWMENENGVWRTRGFHIMLTRLNGRESRDLLAQAEQQRDKNNAFNAYMLYVAAGSTLIQGPYYTDPGTQDYNIALATFPRPAILQGEPPFGWQLGDEYFSVNFVQYQAMNEGEPGLYLYHAPADAKTFAEADAINRSLIEKFDKAYPEWRDVFAVLAVHGSVAGTDDAWITGFSRDTGFIPPTNLAPQDDAAQADAAPSP